MAAIFREASPVLQRALRRRLSEVAEPVRSRAAANVTHKTGRHGNPGPALENTLKIGVSATSVSIYSNAIHSIVQDQGGRVGRHGATLLRRANVSQYMTRAVQQETPKIQAALEAAIDETIAEMEAM